MSAVAMRVVAAGMIRGAVITGRGGSVGATGGGGGGEIRGPRHPDALGQVAGQLDRREAAASPASSCASISRRRWTPSLNRLPRSRARAACSSSSATSSLPTSARLSSSAAEVAIEVAPTSPVVPAIAWHCTPIASNAAPAGQSSGSAARVEAAASIRPKNAVMSLVMLSRTSSIEKLIAGSRRARSGDRGAVQRRAAPTAPRSGQARSTIRPAPGS